MPSTTVTSTSHQLLPSPTQLDVSGAGGSKSNQSVSLYNASGVVSNNQMVTVNKPEPGTWTARIVWNNGRSHLQDPPPVPGGYTGNISVRFTGESAVTSKATGAVSIPAQSSVSVPLKVALPGATGDAPESVDFVTNKGAATSVPIARRTVIPPAGAFTFSFGSAVSRGFGPLESRQFTVPAGEKDLRVTFKAPDTSADNIIDYFLVEPNGLDGYYDRSPSTAPQGIGSSTPNGNGAIVVANPTPGTWVVEAMVDLTESGKEFTQTIKGKVAFDTGSATGYSGIPASTAKLLKAGSKTTLLVGVKNTTGVGRTFQLQSTNGDVSGSTVYIPAGATALVTGSLTAPAGPGAQVTGTIYVVSNGSDLSPLVDSQGYFFDLQSVATFPYAYTVN